MSKRISPEYEERKKIAGGLFVDQRNRRNGLNENNEYQRETQDDVGKRAGISSKRVWQWENGDLPNDREKLLEIIKAYRFTDKEQANKILQVLNLPPRYFLAELSDSEWEYVKSPIPDDESQLKPSTIDIEAVQFRMGKLKLPLVRIIGGNGEIRYKEPDGIQTVFHNTQLILPRNIHENYYYLLEQRKQESKGAVFESKSMIRLDDYETKLSDPDDEPWPLVLRVSLTNYFDMMVTNKSLDTILVKNKYPLRNNYAVDPFDLSNSKLANPLAVNLTLVTKKDNKIYIARRGSKVATNPDGFGPAISGTANPVSDLDDSKKYSPFITAQRESYEEITQPYRPDKSEITFFGLARTTTYFFPFLFGELRLNIGEAELRSFVPHDNWDTRGLIGINFIIEDVVNYIKKLYRYMLTYHNNRVGTTIFSLYQSLIYQYPDKRIEIIDLLSKIQI